MGLTVHGGERSAEQEAAVGQHGERFDGGVIRRQLRRHPAPVQDTVRQEPRDADARRSVHLVEIADDQDLAAGQEREVAHVIGLEPPDAGRTLEGRVERAVRVQPADAADAAARDQELPVREPGDLPRPASDLRRPRPSCVDRTAGQQPAVVTLVIPGARRADQRRAIAQGQQGGDHARRRPGSGGGGGERMVRRAVGEDLADAEVAFLAREKLAPEDHGTIRPEGEGVERDGQRDDVQEGVGGVHQLEPVVDEARSHGRDGELAERVGDAAGGVAHHETERAGLVGGRGGEGQHRRGLAGERDAVQQPLVGERSSAARRRGDLERAADVQAERAIRRCAHDGRHALADRGREVEPVDALAAGEVERAVVRGEGLGEQAPVVGVVRDARQLGP